MFLSFPVVCVVFPSFGFPCLLSECPTQEDHADPSLVETNLRPFGNHWFYIEPGELWDPLLHQD